MSSRKTHLKINNLFLCIITPFQFTFGKCLPNNLFPYFFTIPRIIKTNNGKSNNEKQPRKLVTPMTASLRIHHTFIRTCVGLVLNGRKEKIRRNKKETGTSIYDGTLNNKHIIKPIKWLLRWVFDGT